MRTIFSLFVLASLCMVSCKKTELSDDPVTTAEPEKTIESVMPPQTAPAGTTSNSVMNGTANYSTTTTTPAAATPVAAAPGMNPPHGQPGHRCEIAVGAPLNSAPKNAPAATTAPVGKMTQPVTISSATTTPGTVTSNGATITTVNNNAPATPVVTAPGMNPPHGEAGHVCSVAVGAPLPK
jgi:hypothetical protein